MMQIENVDCIPELDAGVRHHFSVVEDGLKHELLFLKKDINLIVFLPSWNSKRKAIYSSRPEFTRNAWCDLPYSTVCVSDPTMLDYPDVRSGWHLGRADCDALDGLIRIIQKIRTVNGMNGKLLFYGSSMGGFTALRAASCIEGALAIAEVPQLDLRKFKPSRLLLGNIFNINFEENVYPSNIVHRINVIDMFVEKQNVPRCYIVQKESDQLHLKEHLLPFLSQLYNLPFSSDNIHVEIIGAGADASGHSALSKHEAMSRIDFMLGGGCCDGSGPGVWRMLVQSVLSHSSVAKVSAFVGAVYNRVRSKF
ncbi:hypothetical protein [Desulfovibrio subterraneus]|nr:hypothetical protein [Desulfovibrio subterraneus]